MIGSQKFSDSASLYFDLNTKRGSLLSAPVAVKLEPGEPDRIALHVSWTGERARVGRHYVIVPAFKTSFGYKRGEAFRFHIQQGYWGEQNSQPDAPLTPHLMTLEKADEVPVDWSR